jgi:hypothetical protein
LKAMTDSFECALHVLHAVRHAYTTRTHISNHDCPGALVYVMQETMRSASGGGSVSSNMTLLWHQLQLAAHLASSSAVDAAGAKAADAAQAKHYKRLLGAFITAATVRNCHL